MIEHRVRVVLVAGVAAVATAAVAVVALGVFREPAAVHMPAFLARSLGDRQHSAPLVRTPVKDATVKLVDRSGVSVHQKRGATIGLEALLSGDAWATYRHGVARSTDSGVETITVHPGTVEESIVVASHHGNHIWSWQLHTGDWTPRIDLAGGVSFASGHSVAGIVLDKPVILDVRGRNITPKGAHWTLDGKTLSLSLDDSNLPTPYVIDPIINIQATCNIGANGSTTSCVSLRSTGSGVTSISPALPSGAAAGDVLVFAVAKGDTAQNFSTPSGGTGTWTLQDSIRNGASAVQTAIFTGVVVSGETAPSTSWTTSTSATGVLIDYTGVNQSTPVNAANGTSGNASAIGSLTVTTTVANTLGFAAWATATNTPLQAGGTVSPTQEYQFIHNGNPKLGVLGEDAQIAATGISNTFTTGVATGAAYAGNIVALQPMPDGVGTIASNVSNVSGGATGQSITFTYTAPSSGTFGGEVDIAVPTGWTTPTTSNAAGCVSASTGSIAISTRTIQWTGLTLTSAATATVTYGATSGGSCAGGDTATATTTAGPATWTTTQRSTAGGTLTSITGPSINVYAADGTGTGTVSPTSTLAGTTTNTETATYTVATGGVAANAVVELTIPANWTAPQKTTNNAAGYTTATAGGSAVAAGNIAVSGSGPWTVDVTLPAALNSGQTVVITYGDTSSSASGSATDPSAANAGNSLFTIKEKSTSGGTLTTVPVGAGTQTVAVNNSADGSGTLVRTSVLNIERGSAGNTVAFTYTAGTGGLNNGSVTIAVPSGWSSPSTSSSAKGYTTSDAGSVGVAGQLITISGLTLDGGATVHIVYGSTAGTGTGADAVATYNVGNQTWQAQEKSTSGGTLTNLVSSPITHEQDTTPPTVSGVTASNANGSYKAGQTIHVQVNFSEPVNVTGSPKLALNTSPAQSATYASGSGSSTLVFDYTVQAGDNVATLDYTATNSLTLNGGSIADPETNNATLTLASPGAAGSLSANKNVAIDTTAPTVSNVTTSNANGSYKAGQTIHVQANFSEPVNVTGNPKLALNTTPAESATYASGSGTSTLVFEYTVQAGDNVVTLDYTGTGALTLNGGTIADLAANAASLTLASPGAAGSLSNSKSITIDTTAPTVTNVTASNANGAYKAGQTIHVQVSFSEPVNVTGNPQLALNTSPAQSATYASGSGTSTLVFDYTVQAGDNAATLDYTGTGALTLNGGTIADPATNNATLTLASPGAAGSLAANKTIVIDTTAPTVSNVTASNANGSYKAGQTIHLQVTFSEPVNVTGSPKLALNTTPAESATYASGSGTSSLTFDYTVQAGDNVATLDYTATGALTLNGGAIADAAANDATLTLASPGAAGSLSNNKSLTIDTAAPTVSNVTASNANGSYKAGQTIHLQVAFSEAVTVTGTPHLLLETGATDQTASYASGSGSPTLVFDYTVQVGDTSADLDYHDTGALTLNGGTIADPAANDATLTLFNPGAAGSLSANKDLVIDTTAPTVSSVSASNANGSYKAGQTIHVQVNFSEPVNVTGSPKLALNTSPAESATYASGSGTSSLTFDYTVQAGDTAATLDYTGTGALTLNGGTIADPATNNATLTLASPGAAGSLSANKGLTIDTTAPTVGGVTASTANGAYKAGQTIHVQVNFSEPVTVTGSPQLLLETGATDQTATYASGSGSSTLVFDYTVQTGDTSADLDYHDTGALTLNGGTIADPAANNATLTLASPGAANSLGANKNIVVDTTAPTVSSVSASNANGAYKAGQTIHVQVNFSEPVNVTGSPQLALNMTPGESATYASGSGTSTLVFDYTVQAGDNVATLDYTATNALTLNGGTITDPAANNATLTLASPGGAGSLSANKSLTIDTTAPTVSTVTASNSNGAYKAGQTIHIQVNFSEPVTVTGTPQLLLETGATDQSATYASGSGSPTLVFDYTVQAGDTSADLDYHGTDALTLNGGTITDPAGNNATLILFSPGAAGSLSANKDLVIDTTAPTVSGVTASNANGSYKAGQTIHVQISLSEPVNVTGNPQLALNTTPAESATYASGTGTSTLVFDYTVQAGDTAATLDYTATNALTLNGGTIADPATNNATLTLASPGAAGSLAANKTIVIDTTAPTVSNVTASNANGSYKAGQTIHLQVDFSEPVNVTGGPQLALNTSPGESATYASGSGSSTLTFDYTVQAGDNVATLDYTATNSLTLNGGTIADPATNNATLTLASPGAAGSLAANKSITIDTTAPTVSSGTIDGATLDITYSEPLDPGSVPAGSDFAVSVNGGGDAVDAVTYTTGNTVVELALHTTVLDLDTVTVAYSGTAIQDPAGNQAATYTAQSVTNNTANGAPDTPATLSPADGAKVTTATPTLTASFSDPDSGNTGTIDFRVCGNATCTAGGDPIYSFSSPSGIANGASGSAEIPSGLADGTYYWSARATDNTNAHSSYTTARSITIDTVAPTNVFSLIGVGTVGGFPVAFYPGSGSTIYYNGSAGSGAKSFTLEAAVTDVTTGGASITTQNFASGGSNLAHTAGTATTPGSGTFDTNGFSFAPITTGNGAVDVFTTDGAGNQSSTTSFTIQNDTVAPTASVTFPSASVYNTAGWTGSLTGTASDSAAGVNAVKVAIHDNTANADYDGSSFGGGGQQFLTPAGTTSWSYALVAGKLTDGHSYTVTVETIDNIGNTDPSATSKTFTYDTTAPAVSSVSASNANGSYKAGQTIHLQVNFSEPVNVTGSPQLALNTTPAESATYASGSGSSTLVFDYAVQAGDNVATLDYTATNALTLNGGTIADPAGNNATLTLANPGAAGSLSNSKSIAIDTTAPAVGNVTASNANGAYKAGQTIHLQVTFSEPVTVTGSPQLALNTTPAESATYASGSGTSTLNFDYLVQAGDNAASLDYTGTGALTLNGGTIADPATNNATLTLASPGAAGSLSANKSLTIDTTAPTVSNVTASTANGAYMAGQTIHLQVTFSEPVTVTGSPQLALNTTPAESATYASGSGTSTLVFDYNVQAGDNAAKLDYTATGALTLNGGTIRDAATNDATLTLPTPSAAGSLSANKAIVIDTGAPTVTSRTVDGTTLDITYSEPPDSGSSPATSDFTVKVNGNADAVDADAFAGGNTIVRLTLHTAAQYLDTVTVAYTGTAVQDPAGNQAAMYSAQAVTNLTPDTAPSTPALGAPADGVFIDSTTPTLSASFSDPDTLDTGKVTFEVCTTSNCLASLGTFDSSSTTLNVGQSGSAAAPAGFSLQTGTTYYWRAKNVDASSAASSFSATRSFTVDTTAPNVTVAAPVATSGGSYQHYDGPSKTLWLNANQAGSFTLEANAIDAQSGIAKVNFPAIFGTGSNDQTSPASGSNYESSVYSFDGTGGAFSSPGSKTITAYNGDTIPGAITDTDSLTVNADGSGPAAFSLGGPADATKVRTGVIVSASPTDAGSGVDQVAFYECDATLHAGCDPTNTSLFGAQIGATSTAVAGVYSIAWNNTGLMDGHSYAIAAVATDNVANTTTSSINTVVVDNSAPAVAVAVPTPVTGAAAQYYNAGSKTLFLKAAGQGSFKLEASASDAQTGISSVTFPSLLGTGSNTGTNTGGSNYESSTYSFDGTGTPISSPGAETITAANGVTLPSAGTASDSLTVTADGSPVSTNVQFPVDHGGYDSSSWNPGAASNCSGAPAGGNICGTVSDGTGSGVASVTLTIEQTISGTTTYYDGSSFTSATPVPLSATLAGSNWSYALDQSKLSAPDSYVVTVHATDNVGNTEVDQLIHFTFGTDLTPPATTLSLTGASHAYLLQVGTHPAPNAGNDYNLYYSTVNSGGAFTLHAHSTDQSGIASVVFPDLTGTTGFTGAGGTQNNGSANPWDVDSPTPYTFSSAAITAPGQKLVSSVDTVTPTGNTSDNTLTFLLDNAAPTGGALTVDGTLATSGGVPTWATSTSVTVDSRTDYSNDGAGSGMASSVLTVASATLNNGVCGSYGSPTTITGTDVSGVSFASGNCYLFTLTGTDNVGNAATLSATVMIDTTAPSQPTIGFTGLSAGNTYDNGVGTLFFRPSDGGTFTVNANGSTDAESGIKSGNSGYTFSPLSGNLSGTQTGNQLAVTFDHTSSGSNAYTVHSTNNAGLDSADANFTVTADSTAPSGGGLTVNGTAAAAVATSSYLNTGTTVTIDSRTDYTDAGSGLASSTLTVQSATLANNTCGSYGSPSTISGATPQTVSSGHCYLFTLTGTDNVGNATSLSTVVMVDTTPPSQPTVSITGLSAGNTFLSGSTLFFRPSAGGTFTVTANGSSDAETGIKPGNSGYTFSDLNTSGGANFGTTQTGNQLAVIFDGTTTGPTVGQSIVVNNNAGLGSTPGTFTVTQDSTAPTGGSVSVNPYSSSLTISVSSVAFTDSGSGVVSNVITRSDPLAPSGPGSCPGTGYVDTGANVVSGATDTVPTDGQCYQYTETAKDAVGNVASVSTIVLVDTTGPSGGSIGYADGVTSLAAVSVGWDSGTDAQSGIGQILVQRASATLTGTTCGTFSSFSTIVTNPGSSPISDSTVSAGNCYEYQLAVTNGTGLATTYGSSSIAKIVNGSPIGLAPGASSGAYLAGTTLYLGSGGGTFQLQLTSTGQNGVTDASWQGKGSSGSLTSSPAADFAAASSPFASGTYTWSGGGISDSIQVTRDPTSTLDTLSVQSDTTAPTGSVSYTNGLYGSASVPVTTSASDAGSGVASTQVQRAQTSFTGATCDNPNWTGFSNVTLTGGVDNTVTGGHCYQYQLIATDNVGNSATFNNANVAQIPDVTPPTFVSASTNAAGTQLTINMSESLDCSATTPASAFLVTYNGIAQPAPTALTCSGSSITLDLPTSPNNSQTVKLTYTQPAASGDRVRDLAVPSANATTSFGPTTAMNNTTDTVPPALSSATVDGTTLTIAFSEALAGAAPDVSAFTVSVDGHPIAVTGTSISGNVLTLTLAQAVTSSDTVAVSYAVPALNALHDAAANDVAPFSTTATNQTPMILLPPSGGGGGVGPAFVSASPQDGSTVGSVAAITLGANESVSWTNMKVTRPDGSTTTLDDRTGASETWTFATSTAGLYIVTGTLSAGGQSESILSHFTIWVPPVTNPDGTAPTAPPVEKNAVPQLADTLKAADGNTLMSWPVGTFGDAVVIEIASTTPSALTGIPAGSTVVDVTAFMRSNHRPVTDLGEVADIQFPHAPEGATPVTSQDAKTWRAITQLPTFNLPDGQTDGWFRDSDGTVHVLTRHLAYYALVTHGSATKLALRILTARRLWIDNRTFVAVRMALTAPARVTGSFVGPNGETVPGQTIKTPTRRAGITILRVPLHVTKPGTYRLQMHADGIGQVVNRTAKITFVQRRPASPLWQVTRPLRIVVIRGAGASLSGLSAGLGHGYLVLPLADSELYTAVDPASGTAAAVVVVDLGTVPMQTLVGLRALLPELKIIGLTNDPSIAAYARTVGVNAVLTRSASAAHVADAIVKALRKHS